MIRLVVPDGFETPFPKQWGPRDNALALELGADAMKRFKIHNANADPSTSTRQQIQDALASMLADRKPLEDEITRAKSELLSERAQRTVEIFKDREKLREQIRESMQDEIRRHDERSREAERQLALERGSQRQLATLHEADTRNLRDGHQEDKRRFAAMMKTADEKICALSAELVAKNNSLVELSVSARKGAAIEAELNTALHDGGLFSYNTSRGVHNLNYHDSVVASVPLHEVAGEDKVPSYVADTKAVRCSLESKGHSRSGGIGVERGKFEQVRRRLMEARRAECFVFAATTPIPGINARWHFEFTDIGGRHCVTGYIGAKDSTSTEVCMVVQLVLKLQEKLDKEIILHQQPGEETLSRFVEHAVWTLHAHRDQISRCDKMDGAITHLRDEVKGLREVLIASLFAQMKVLSNTGFLPKDDTLVDVREAHESLSSTRLSNCKLLKNKEQFEAASTNQSSRKRHRT